MAESPPPSAANPVFSTASADQAATFRSFFKTYNTLSEECFNHCVWDFGVAKVRAKEDRCVDRCAGNYLAMVKEIGERFAETKEKELNAAATNQESTQK